MNNVQDILRQVHKLGLEDSKLVAQALIDHLEELDDIAAYDRAKDSPRKSVSLKEVLARYAKSSGS